jgi:hypothetical protein
MSKLPTEHRFLDLSDYGRPVARQIANALKDTNMTPIHVTLLFIVAGIIAIACIINHQYWAAFFFLIVKSILDAADGELARVKRTPSYTGRYLDSVADIILNFFFLLSIWYVAEGSILFMLMAFLGLQLQGTLYNYYYVILRNKVNGDKTSRVFEHTTPIAMPGEQQRHVDTLFGAYYLLYGGFDKIIFWLDKKAPVGEHMPKLLMTAVSSFGLGFQLLVMGAMLCLGWANYIIPFFISYTAFILVFIAIRRLVNR